MTDKTMNAECPGQKEKLGWKSVAYCRSTREVAQILEKDGKRVHCQMDFTAQVPVSHPCTPFTGDLAKFKAAAQKATERAKKVEEASKAKKLDAFMKANPTRAYCMAANGEVPTKPTPPAVAPAAPAKGKK